MGYVDQRLGHFGTRNTTPHLRTTAQDLIWMAALGAASSTPLTAEDLRQTIDDLCGHWWSPSTDLLASGLSDLAQAGCLEPVCGLPGSYMLTAQGLPLMSTLMNKPLPHAGCPLAQAGLRIKLAFLHLLSPDDCCRLLTDVIEDCHQELQECERRCDLCSVNGTFGRQWLTHERDGLRLSLSLLKNLQSRFI